MFDENGIEMSEKQILEESLNLMAEVCSLLFETESEQAKAAGFMADSLLKYINVIYRDDNVLEAACDYQAYEYKVYRESGKHLRVIK